MSQILREIIKYKKKEIASQKKKKSLAALRAEALLLPVKKPRFFSALAKGKSVSVIAEIKKKSPSKGILRKKFNAFSIAKAYEKGGASALSVLTDSKFFGGSAEILKEVKRVTALPILRKDFVIDAYQVYESRLLGADAILLIARSLTASKLKALGQLAQSLGMDVLFEIHRADEIKKIKLAGAKLVGINNRDLNTFKVTLEVTAKLRRLLPKNVLVVSESGIQKHEDLIYLKRLKVKAVLVGEHLMRQKNECLALQKLLGVKRGQS